ncbi:hypothetical protein [Chryseobacterium mucoviscidosis]|uniref:Uncharacterized protein n=1 Tax=Chryseobacterium mucoviscidosis TaxID=1945581 RepID=A0A202C183_9FLAO|nr:hypothetical protein [Chryseobacterium mucoviscidosis]OVE57498.1 hypothetical protein B0E34_10080 [Chryseobacterium mucoviscidosis]
MKWKSTIFLLFTIIFCEAQISEKVKMLAKPLDTIQYAESSHIGIGGERSKLYDDFRKLAKNATNDELFYLAKNGSNSLRLYSGKELFKRNDKRFLEIYQYYHDNPLFMKYINGCMGKEDHIANHLMDEMYAAKEIISIRDSISKEKTDNFTKAQLKSIEDEGYEKLKKKEIQFFLDHLVKKK